MTETLEEKAGAMKAIERLELALHQIAGHGNITGAQARKIASDALTDLKVERILEMTDAEVLEGVSDEELEKAKVALEATKRRLGL